MGRTVYYVSNTSFTASQYPEPAPGGAEIVPIHPYNAGYGIPACTVVLADGGTYHWSGTVHHWALAGVVSGTTQGRASSWGQMKSQFR